MSHDCATVNQYHNAILQFNGVLSLFTTGSNTTALPDNAGIIAAGVISGLSGLGVAACCLIVAVIAACKYCSVADVKLKGPTSRGWCMCMFCTCNCRSYYFVMWACWIHAQASFVTAGKFEGKCYSSMIMNVDNGKFLNLLRS